MQLMDIKGKSVYVGLSGGVDSAVAAALLKRAGARVTGVFIKGWYPSGLPCTWGQDRRDAMRVAARLEIPFATLDAAAEYKRGVIEYLLAEYKAGRTPNPDVMCNKEVKFGAFYRYAIGHGADYIATGHYARMEQGALSRGADPAKDQSYFLWAVPAEILGRSLFPLGSLTKREVRDLARRLDLPVAQKRDSQGICFLGPVSIEDFLREEFRVEPGAAYDERGERIGEHGGALLHTLGERVSLDRAREQGPWFVVAKDIERNVLTVSHSHHTRSGEGPEAIAFSAANWLGPADGHVEAQLRYHGPVVRGELHDSSRFLGDSPFSEQSVPGQSIVFYEEDRLIGGGIIAG